MAYTLSQLQAIEAAIATGTTRVEIDGRIVQYQKLSDLIALRDLMRSEIGEPATATARGKAWMPTTSTGL